MRHERHAFRIGRLPYRATPPAGWTVEETVVGGDVADLFTDGDHSVIGVGLVEAPAVDFFENVSDDYRGTGRLVDEERVAVGTLDGRLYRCRERRILRGDRWWIHVAFRNGPYWGWTITLERYDGRRPDEAALRQFLGAFESLPIQLRQDDPTDNVWALQIGECFRSVPPLIADEPGAANIFVGGLDGFRRVSCDDPHTGQVLAVIDQPRPGLDRDQSEEAELAVMNQAIGLLNEWSLSEEASQNGFGLVLCLPVGDEPRPTDVGAVLVAAHQSGLWSGSLVDEFDSLEQRAVHGTP